MKESQNEEEERRGRTAFKKRLKLGTYGRESGGGREQHLKWVGLDS